MSRERRKEKVETEHPRLSITRQCELMGISRSSWYYEPLGESPKNLELMHLIDELFMEEPSCGVRLMARYLRREGHWVNRKRVRRLMRKMGLMPIYEKPDTSKPHPEHKRYPYLLKGMNITEPNQVWCSDVTYIPMRKGFLYLVAIMDWASHKVLSWRLSNSLDTDFCVSALKEALTRYGNPEIFNTDQGSQFTSAAFTGRLMAADVKISMDGRGRWMDNVFIERLWRSLKYEDVYLKGYADGREARAGIASWMAFYNLQRPHQALANRTPMAVWRGGTTGALDGQAVDMTLVLRTSLDNAAALPTSPQPPQQQQVLVA